MMTPVENGSTASLAQPSIDATAAQVARASASPRSPVPAFALPALTTSARERAVRREVARGTRVTGAAQNRFCVNTPAATVPGSQTTSTTSLRSHFLMRAAAAPSETPGTGGAMRSRRREDGHA